MSPEKGLTRPVPLEWSSVTLYALYYIDFNSMTIVDLT